MTDQEPPNLVPQDLLTHLSNTSNLNKPEAARIVTEVLHYFDQTTDEYIRQRHQELQKSGLSNPQIYQLIEQELSARVFRSEKVSIRQIRRTIYG